MAPMFSSLDTPVPTPDTTKAKARKPKGSTDSSVKKRKREEEKVELAEPSTTEPATKKTKKRKSKAAEDITEAGDGSGLPATTTTPAPQREDVDEKPVIPDTPAAEPLTPATAIKAKKSRKSKVAENPPAQSPAPTPAPATEKKKKTRKPKASVEESPVLPVTNAFRSSQAKIQKAEARPDTANATPEELLQTCAPFVQQTSSFYLALSPCAHDFPLEGLCAEHISPLLLTYYPPLKGIVLSYSHPRMSEHPDSQQVPQAGSSNEAKTVLARSIDEYAVTYVWLTVEFLIFRPQRGAYLEGYVNLQNESILGLVCYNYFNAGVERSRLPKDWRWVSDDGEDEGKGKQRAGGEGDGYWVDEEGKKVEGRLVFRVRDFEATAGSETGAGSINIHGTLLGERDDEARDDAERQKGLVR